MFPVLLLLSAAAGTTLALTNPHHLVARAANLSPYSDPNNQLVSYVNCYTDSATSRALSGTPATGLNGTAMTVQMCAFACSSNNFPISGTEYGGECYCGSALPTSATIVSTATTGCSMSCNGDVNTFCSGDSQPLLSQQANVAASDSKVSYVGCGTVTGGGAPFTAYTTLASPTVDSCASIAIAGGYKGFSLKQTTCLLYPISVGVTASVSSCTVICGGNSLKLCGSTAAGVEQIYSISGTNVPSTSTASFITTAGQTFSYLGCFTDNAASRTLSTNTFVDQNTPLACISACASLGFIYAGVEYGAECWCGNSQAASGTLLPQVNNVQPNCIAVCKGDPLSSCGGGNALQIYKSSSFSGFTVASPNPKNEVVSYLGCHADSTSNRIFPLQITGLGPLTPLLCTKACSAKFVLSGAGVPISYPYAGLQYGNECWCSPVAPSTPIEQILCTSMACAGASTSWCGGGNKMVVYYSAPAVTPSPISTYGAAASLGCFLTAAGTTPSQYTVFTSAVGSTILNVEYCITACSSLGYAYAGLVGAASSAVSCQCSQIFTATTADGTCNIPCPASGFAGEACGGYSGSASSTSVYKTNAVGLVVAGSVGSTSATFATGLSSAAKYIGCYVDSALQRVLATQGNLGATLNSPTACLDKCTSMGFTLAGVEYATECWCGSVLPAAWTGSPTNAAFGKSGECNVRACPGSSTQACGAGNRLAVYSSGGAVVAPTVQASIDNFIPAGTTTPTSYVSLGCFADNYPTSRTLRNSVAVSANSPQVCATACFNLGYKYAGLEYASECYCANAMTATVNNASPSPCNMPCAGDSAHFCGGSNFLNIYLNSGMTATNVVNYAVGAAVWSYAVCWHEPANGRALNNPINNNAVKTINSCLTLAGSTYNTCGIEYGGECWCGNAFPTTGTQISEAYCSSYTDGNGAVQTLGMVCTGNSLQWCGAGNILAIYTTYAPNPAIVKITTNPT